MGHSSQPGQIPSSPCVFIISEPPEIAKLQVKGPQSNPFSLLLFTGRPVALAQDEVVAECLGRSKMARDSANTSLPAARMLSTVAMPSHT